MDGRCAAVLSAGRRCPNASLEGSRYCGLPQHQALARFETNQVTVLSPLTDEEIQKLADPDADEGEIRPAGGAGDGAVRAGRGGAKEAARRRGRGGDLGGRSGSRARGRPPARTSLGTSTKKRRSPRTPLRRSRGRRAR